MDQHSLLANIGLVFIVATAFAFAAKLLRQPLMLAYLVAGVVIGPGIGLALVKDEETIELISEIGLILLLFIIGLEIDLKKLLSAGRTLLVTGISQFLVCAAAGIELALMMGYRTDVNFDWLYLAVTLALSSTLIVVKLLYDKFELTTLPGRITLGVLVCQDIWAIVFLALQPSLHDPRLGALVESFVKGAALVFTTLAVSRYVLPRLFSFVAKIPELMLIAALAWCFLVSGAADGLELSREMGALIAGVSMSTFPYNVDVIAKVINIRDFFVTLFFVALGMKIPAPTAAIVGAAAVMSLFVLVSRMLSVFPALYLLGNGIRASLVPAINLAQMSEFSLVIVSLGLTLKHVSPELVGILTLVFAITSVLSTYLISYNHEIQRWLARYLVKIGFASGGDADDVSAAEEENRIVFLGCFREASSILHELESQAAVSNGEGVLRRTLVVDFNPLVLQELKRRAIRCLYGDIAHMDTLHHARIGAANLVVSTISDAILRGTTNLRLLRQARRLCPNAQVIVAADTIAAAVELYDEGADFVYVARLHSANYMAELIAQAFQDEDVLKEFRGSEMERLKQREEVLR
ncbi:MAG TPA: cation:proton antiporter [Candidatus Binatia bacterium]|nr:cation:proton antiporter [Candidatus Binatia bacterium]